MYSPVNATSSVDKLRKAQAILDEKGLGDLYHVLREVIDTDNSEIQNIYRLFRRGAEKKKGGGSVAGASSPIKKPYLKYEIVLESERLETPAQIAMWSLWNRHNARLYHYTEINIDIKAIGGVIWIEGHSTRIPEQHYIRAIPVLGSTQIPANSLIGYDVGFERYDADRKKFFIDIFEFPKEGTTQLTEEIPISSRKFRSVDTILSDTLLSEYGNEGLRFKCQLDLFAQF